jgi:protein-S-isoprenylcysteine O-methyltransferase Ste14
MLLKIFIYLTSALVIFILFRGRLHSKTPHSPYLFFALLALLLQLVLNLDFLYTRRIYPLGILSTLFFSGGLFFVLAASYSLKKFGTPVPCWEETVHLVTQGIYRYVRHPFNTGLILLSLGILLRRMNLTSALSCTLSLILLLAATIKEEAENRMKFGSVYNSYIKATKAFIPFLI